MGTPSVTGVVGRSAVVPPVTDGVPMVQGAGRARLTT